MRFLARHGPQVVRDPILHGFCMRLASLPQRAENRERQPGENGFAKKPFLPNEPIVACRLACRVTGARTADAYLRKILNRK